MDLTGSGTPAHGTKRRRGSFTAGSTRTVNATCCGTCFSSLSARALIPAWEDRARRLLAEFRADFAHTFRDARVKAFVDALRAESALFAEAWDEQAVQTREGGLRTFHHPRDGLVSFTQHTFAPAERPDYKLVMLAPADS